MRSSTPEKGAAPSDGVIKFRVEDAVLYDFSGWLRFHFNVEMEKSSLQQFGIPVTSQCCITAAY